MHMSITVNGHLHHASVEPRLLLVDFLRDTLGLTGTKSGCDTGRCGVCTVLVNGVSVKSCMVLAVQAADSEVTTIEGISSSQLTHLQNGFWEMHGLQCGFCTPGMIMALTDLLQHNPNPSEDEIRQWLDGVICRCTGYHNVIRAVQYAAKKMQQPDLETANSVELST